MLPCEILDMSAANVPLISTLSMSNTVVKSSLWQAESQGENQRNKRLRKWGPKRSEAGRDDVIPRGLRLCVGTQGHGARGSRNWHRIGTCSGHDLKVGDAHLLDCISTVPLMMISRRSWAHSVVCWVLRCTVSNMPPTCRDHKSVRWFKVMVSFLRKSLG